MLKVIKDAIVPATHPIVPFAFPSGELLARSAIRAKFHWEDADTWAQVLALNFPKACGNRTTPAHIFDYGGVTEYFYTAEDVNRWLVSMRTIGATVR